MPVLHPKSRTISFRLSQAEYTLAEAISHEQLFDSLSDFARYAVLSFGCAEPAKREAGELRQMKRRMDVLMLEITKLSKKVSGE